MWFLWKEVRGDSSQKAHSVLWDKIKADAEGSGEEEEMMVEIMRRKYFDKIIFFFAYFYEWLRGIDLGAFELLPSFWRVPFPFTGGYLKTIFRFPRLWTTLRVQRRGRVCFWVSFYFSTVHSLLISIYIPLDFSVLTTFLQFLLLFCRSTPLLKGANFPSSFISCFHYFYAVMTIFSPFIPSIQAVFIFFHHCFRLLC